MTYFLNRLHNVKQFFLHHPKHWYRNHAPKDTLKFRISIHSPQPVGKVSISHGLMNWLRACPLQKVGSVPRHFCHLLLPNNTGRSRFHYEIYQFIKYLHLVEAIEVCWLIFNFRSRNWFRHNASWFIGSVFDFDVFYLPWNNLVYNLSKRRVT